MKAIRDARYHANLKDYCHRPRTIQFSNAISEQQERQSELDSDPKRHLIIKDASNRGTLLQKIPPPNADFRTLCNKSIAIGTDLKNQLFDDQSIGKNCQAYDQQGRLGVSMAYGGISWTVDHRKNIEAANDFWTWLHDHSGLYVEPFEALLEEDFATDLQRRKEQGLKNLETFVDEEVIKVFRPWWTTATIHDSSSGLLEPHRDKSISQPVVFLNFEKTVQLCLQLVKNEPILKLPVASNQVVFLNGEVVRLWIEGVEEGQWAVTLSMGVNLLDDDNDRVKSLQWHGSSLEPLPIVEQVKTIPIKKI